MTNNAAVLPNLWNATATTFNAGASVFVMGGGVAGGAATNSAFVITTMANGAVTVADVTSALVLPARKNHTATLVGNDILLCGGVDAGGKAIGSCDLVTTSPSVNYDTTKNPIPNLIPRQNHVAVALETGPVLFVGGDDGAGNSTAQIDIYTPTMAEEAIINKNNGAVISGATADGGS